MEAVAVLPVLFRSSERIWMAVVPVTLTPFELRQLLKAARAELLIARRVPLPKPDGAYLAQALNAAEFAPPKDARGRGDPVGKSPGEKDPVGLAPNFPGVTFTPCCFRHVSKTLTADAVALAEAWATGVLVGPEGGLRILWSHARESPWRRTAQPARRPPPPRLGVP